METIRTKEQLQSLVEDYSTKDAFAFDVETVGPHRGDPRRNDVLWIAMATEGRADVIPLGHPNGDFLSWDKPLTESGKRRQENGYKIGENDYSKAQRLWTPVFTEPPSQLFPGEVFSALKPLFESSQTKVGHNLKFDLMSVAKYLGGVVPKPPYADTLVASFIINNLTKNKLGLDDCLMREFHHKMEKGIGKEVERYSFNEVAQYAYLDAKWTWLLWKKLEKKIKEDRLTTVFKLEMDVLEVLCSMELTGAVIDMDALKDLHDKLSNDLEDFKAAIYKAAGKAFNINSNPEKQKLLFSSKKEGGRGLKALVKTPSGAPSTASEALEKHRGKDDLVDAILDYQDLTKIMTTYVIPYLGGDVTRTVSGKSKTTHKSSLLNNGRVFTDFVQTGAETGRFSSRNPNLQNVPSPSSEYGRAIRNLFIAPPGHKLLVADYSQIEPRIIADFSNDPTMVAAYENGEDIYVALAAPLGLDRKAGKVGILAMSYGVGPAKAASQLGISETEAKEILSGFEAKFPVIYKYKKRVIKEAISKAPTPYVETILRRRRYLPDLSSNDMRLRSTAERQAFNTKIQGSAADIIKVAMIRTNQLLPKKSRLILTVHDELVVVSPDNEVEEAAEMLREAMEGIKVLRIPLIADLKIVDKWGDAK
jgi:DNA polymerase I-like protein with 3'-5' exonuclease and polymerase domains